MRLSNRHVRVSDAERQLAADQLGEHLRSGRISLDEYDQRAAAAYAAHTYADLRPLFTDLPRPPLALGVDPALRDWQHTARRVLYRLQVIGLVGVLALVALVVAAAHLSVWIVAVPAGLLALRWWRRPSRRLPSRRLRTTAPRSVPSARANTWRRPSRTP